MSDIGAFALNLITARSHVRVLAGFTTCHLSLFGETLWPSRSSEGVDGFRSSISYSIIYIFQSRFLIIVQKCGCEILSVGFVTIHLLLNWSDNKEESLIKPDTKNMCSKSTNMCIHVFCFVFLIKSPRTTCQWDNDPL